MSASWALHDTRSPWRDRYRQVPAYVDSSEALIGAMKRDGTQFLVFDRRTGASQWPHLAALMEIEHAPPGLQPLGPLLQTDESPANQVAIYRLE